MWPISLLRVGKVSYLSKHNGEIGRPSSRRIANRNRRKATADATDTPQHSHDIGKASDGSNADQTGDTLARNYHFGVHCVAQLYNSSFGIHFLFSFCQCKIIFIMGIKHAQVCKSWQNTESRTSTDNITWSYILWIRSSETIHYSVNSFFYIL